ncbi:hypothetical protein AWV79_27240 [Cupriavidus sp. UYMMa02A]|nr:hypothetical protein AWV79_27240 [Cupriavidus sp. UYMMa02A]
MASQNEAFSKLIETLHNAASPLVRAGAAEGLGIIGGKVARAELIKALDEAASPEVRAAAAKALGQAALRT